MKMMYSESNGNLSLKSDWASSGVTKNEILKSEKTMAGKWKQSLLTLSKALRHLGSYLNRQILFEVLICS